ncbi:arabinose transporter [Neokomagataea thailandica]|uniref:Arabinose efflux permease family protein n=1 Tax=Neokomagataea tanensis NBRC 106556 TaxID=1223519 RepID=A0ABQ0QIH2_9PROT|nr:MULTISPECIES: arabinose transporter [Neokomagataea]GBR45976.1 arabinose efflux permease family protein [Neokomagataea tanensis NBRC 106556]
MPATNSQSRASEGIGLILLPIMTAVFAGFLIIGLALPVLPLHVQHSLGFGSFVVGLVAGSQFAASLISRVWAGAYADKRGAKSGVVIGLLAAAVSGLLYLLSLAFIDFPTLSVTILLLGRALLGGAESFIITGGVAWGLALVDARSAGRVIAWVGTAMFTAMAVGGPIGTFFYARAGFAAIALVTTAVPLLVLASLILIPAAPLSEKRHRSSFRDVAGAVWLPGLGAAFSSVGYGAILAFSSLLFTDRGWHPIWLAFSAFGAALVVARLVFGHLPDHHGGARIALIFICVLAAGLALIWWANSGLMAAVGSALAGFGYSLIYPGLGSEVVRAVSPENRGRAMGLYTAFLDLALGLGTPVLGWIADQTGIASIFLVSASVALTAIGTTLRLVKTQQIPATPAQ